MDNHFHILVQLPSLPKALKDFRPKEGEVIPKLEQVADTTEKQTKLVSLAPWEKRLLKHLESFYSKQYITKLTAEIKMMRQLGQEQQIEELVQRYLDRFCCISHFMKELKERFTRWFNKKNKRKGTLWMDRFKSVLVEDSSVKMVIAAYIDLNPVRAGLVKDPQLYRWCGYAEAESGSKRAKRGLCRAMGVTLDSWNTHANRYRMWLFDKGKELKKEEKVTRLGVDEATREEVFCAKGKQSVVVRLFRRMAYFTTGRVIGTQSYVKSQVNLLGPKKQNRKNSS